MVVLHTAGRYFGAHRPFSDLFEQVTEIPLNGVETNTSQIKKGDVILFGGGEDISPSFYKQNPSRYTHAGPILSNRDISEEKIFRKAVQVGAKMLGICRGAQLVCALSGGDLIQHVTNHGTSRGHSMVTNEGKEIHVCSVHHQMMNPFKTKHELLGWAKENISTCYLIEQDKNVDMKVEPEVVWFPETQSLGIQYHPEFMASDDEAVKYARELVKKYLL